MIDNRGATGAEPREVRDPSKTDQMGNNQENELEAEKESAAAMDADVPQPADADETTEGQPS